MDRPTVFIVEDDASSRAALIDMLQSQGHEVRAFESAEDFLARADFSRIGCLVADMRLPEMSGLDLQQHLIAGGHDLPVIVITAYGDVPSAVRALRTGAITFLEKPCPPETLLATIDQAIERHRILRGERRHHRQLEEQFDRLTDAEREIVDRVVDGQANKTIAYELGIGLRTVELRRSTAMRKLEVSGVPDLVQKVMLIRNLGDNGQTPTEDTP
jgi:FixJ family two-component response regulator